MKAIKEMREIVSQHLADRNIMNFDTRISHLIPEIDCKCALFFVFSEVRIKDMYKASNPFATIKVDIEDGSLVSFFDMSSIESEIIWTEYKPKPLPEFRLAVQKLFELYDELNLYFFKEKNEIDQAIASRIHEMSDLFSNVIPKEMMPYYLIYGKDFFKWIEQF